jgi:hypothetical protein
MSKANSGTQATRSPCATVRLMNVGDSSILSGRPRAVIFDVDGTLCDVRSVRHFVQGSTGEKKPSANFDSFHEASAACPPFEMVKKLAMSAKTLGLMVLIVTGREAKWASLTAAWLTKNGIPWDELRTRRAKDFRPDHEIKAEIRAEIVLGYEPILAVDDRVDIIAVWQAAQIPTLQVNEMGAMRHLEWPPGAAPDPIITRLLNSEGLL